MAVTESQALALVSLETMRDELRIPQTDTSQTALLTAQIVAAVNFVMQSTGREVADLAELRPAITAVVREQYDGQRGLAENPSFDAWMDPFRSIAG